MQIRVYIDRRTMSRAAAAHAAATLRDTIAKRGAARIVAATGASQFDSKVDVTVVFENRQTVLFRVQEVLRVALPTALPATDPTVLTGAFRVEKSGTYTLNFRTTGGQANPNPVVYDILAIEDRPPSAKFLAPGRPTVKVPSNVKFNLVAAVMTLVLVTIAARPPDEAHAYGYGKAEYVSSGAEGAFIILAAGGILWTAVNRLLHPQPVEQIGLGLGLSVAASLVNLGVGRVLIGAGRRHHSIALEADGHHLMTDVWTSAGVIAGIGAVAMTGWLRLDPIVAIAVAVQIVWTGVTLIRRSWLGLLDRALSPELTRPLAQHLYHTIHDKLLNLPDEVAVFPTHGAGSFCVAPASPERTTTIGRERKTNALAQPQSEEEFIQLALTGLPLYPTYYKYMRELNQRGAKVLGGLPHLQPYSAAEVKALMDEGVAVLDIRHQKQFAAGHIPNSFGIRVDSPVVVWAGWVIPFGSRIVLLGGSPEQREDALRQLIRIGYDDILGYVEGGIDAWAKQYPVETIESIQPRELRERLDDVTLVDVRRLSEWQEEHIPGAIHFEGGRIPWEEWPFRLDKPLVMQCASGSRSMVAVSVLKRRSIHNVIQADGGITKWKMNGFELVRTPADL